MYSSVDSVALTALAAPRTGPCVTIYAGAGRGDGVRLDRLFDSAERELVRSGVAAAAATALLVQPRALARELGPTGFAGKETLVIFAAPAFARAFREALPVGDSVFVGRRFHLRPLLGVLAEPNRYYVLAVSLKHVRLLEVDHGSTRQLPLGRLESGIAAMGYEYQSDLQVHSGARIGRADHHTSIVHGQGVGGERGGEEDLRHFFKRVAEAVAGLALDPRAPRVLATTRDHAALYLGTSRDRMLLGEIVRGNPDRLADGELAARAREVVEAARERERLTRLLDWRERLGSDRATGDLSTVLRLATQKRVQTLFLPASAELWGRYDEETGRLDLHPDPRPGDEELLERAAIATLAGGGAVYEMEHAAALDGAPLAAVLRH